MAKKELLFVLLPVMAGCTPSFAGADFVETAKLVAQDASPLDAGSTELEFRYQHVSADSVFDADSNLIPRGDLNGYILVAKATHGMRERFDASIEVVRREVIEDADGEFVDAIGNVTASARWLFHQDNGNGVAISWVPSITSPFASSSTEDRLMQGQDYWSINNLLVLTYVGGRFNLNLNAGHFLPLGTQRDDQRSEFIADIAMGWQINPWLHFETELNYGHASAFYSNASINYAATIGAIMRASDSVRIDVGLQEVVVGRNAENFTVWIANLSKTF